MIAVAIGEITAAIPRMAVIVTVKSNFIINILLSRTRHGSACKESIGEEIENSKRGEKSCLSLVM